MAIASVFRNILTGGAEKLEGCAIECGVFAKEMYPQMQLFSLASVCATINSETWWCLDILIIFGSRPLWV